MNPPEMLIKITPIASPEVKSTAIEESGESLLILLIYLHQQQIRSQQCKLSKVDKLQ